MRVSTLSSPMLYLEGMRRLVSSARIRETKGSLLLFFCLRTRAVLAFKCLLVARRVGGARFAWLALPL